MTLPLGESAAVLDTGPTPGNILRACCWPRARMPGGPPYGKPTGKIAIPGPRNLAASGELAASRRWERIVPIGVDRVYRRLDVPRTGCDDPGAGAKKGRSRRRGTL